MKSLVTVLSPLAAAAFLAAACVIAAGPAAATSGGNIRLTGHRLDVMSQAELLPHTAAADVQMLNLTLVLGMRAEFDAFKAEFRNRSSPNYRKGLPADELTARFGPTPAAYEAIQRFAEEQGFEVVDTSPNRRTLTVRGTRALVQRVFDVRIEDFQRGEDRFHATMDDPAVPAELAPLLIAIDGLSSIIKPHPMLTPPTPANSTSIGQAYSTGVWPGLNGTGQTIALVEFDNYAASDLTNTLVNAGLPASTTAQVKQPIYLGGTFAASGGSGTTEVLGDIATILGIVPNANVQLILVNDSANQQPTYSQIFNAAVSAVQGAMGGVGGIISYSWGGCELTSNTAKAIQSAVDSILETAELSYLSFFAASGDSGIYCSTNPYQIGVTFPADLASAVAVGGTSLNVVAGSNRYLSENYFNSCAPSDCGSGGYGVSLTVAKPSWQDGFTAAAMRSVPDVSADMDADTGIMVCKGTNSSGAPNCGIFGGTSMATPIWAALWAQWSQAAGQYTCGTTRCANGAGQGLMYQWATSPYLTNPAYYYPASPALNCSYVLHSPACMQGPNNDFAHLGLGSPNIANMISLALGGPNITGVSPASGPETGGTTVTITGWQFVPGITSFYFGGRKATNVVCSSATTCTATTPASSLVLGTGNVNVEAFNAESTSTPTAGWWGPNDPNAFSYTYVIHLKCPPVCPPPF